eukprot:6196651-Pleurochrysis_carterae.AAC.2
MTEQQGCAVHNHKLTPPAATCVSDRATFRKATPSHVGESLSWRRRSNQDASAICGRVVTRGLAAWTNTACRRVIDA